MAYLPFTLSAIVCAAAVPLAESGWLGRLLARLSRRSPDLAVALPPRIPNDAGWELIHSENADRFSAWLGSDSDGLPMLGDEESSLGSHLLIELFDCDRSTLEQEASVGTAMRDAAVESKATVVAESFHEFKPWGVSGAVIIQESHYTIHTWPEHGYAAIDLFYCGGTVNVRRAVEVLRVKFRPKRMKFLLVRRGIQSEVESG